MKTGARGKANSKRIYRSKLGSGFINSASRSSTNEKVARFQFEEVEDVTPPSGGDGEGGEGTEG